MSQLNNKIGDMSYDKLFASMNPAPLVGAGTVARGEAAVTLLRGTLLGKGEDGKLSVYDGKSTAYGILTDDCTIGADDDVNVTVYVKGNFNPGALIVADSYKLTDKDRDVLRNGGIYLTAISD